jgi:hypothetical protein
LVLANIALTAQFISRGAEVREAQQNIKAKYKYNHSHKHDSIKFVMQQLATADKQWDRLAVAAPSSTATIVTEELQQMVMVNEEEESDHFMSNKESGMSATAESETSAEKFACKERKTHTSSRRGYRRAASPELPSLSMSKQGQYVLPTRRSTSRRRKKLAPSNIHPTKCKWCKKWGGGGGFAHGPPNNVPHSKCSYNEDWDGWRPHYVSRKICMEYKEREKCKD